MTHDVVSFLSNIGFTVHHSFIVTFLAPSPYLSYSLTHALWHTGPLVITTNPSLWLNPSDGHETNALKLRRCIYRNNPQPLAESTTRLLHLRVSDNQDDSSKTLPSPFHPFLYSSLTHTHRYIGYRNKPQSLAESSRLKVFGCVTVFDTSVSSNSLHFPLPWTRPSPDPPG